MNVQTFQNFQVKYRDEKLYHFPIYYQRALKYRTIYFSYCRRLYRNVVFEEKLCSQNHKNVKFFLLVCNEQKYFNLHLKDNGILIFVDLFANQSFLFSLVFSVSIRSLKLAKLINTFQSWSGKIT